MLTMKSLRIIAALLALLTTLVVFTACAQNNDSSTDTTTPTPQAADTTPTDGGEASSTEAETTVSPLMIPDDLKFTDKTFTIFTWSNQTQWEWDADKLAGELIGDAIYNRKLATEERFDIKLNVIKQPGEWNNRNSFIQAVAGSVLTESHAYDIVGQYTPAAAIGTMQSLYTDLHDVEHLNISSSWWPGDISEACSINGKLYFATGDITPTLIRNMGTVIVNLDMVENLGLENVYDIVDNGNWTLEKLKELALGHVSLDGEAFQSYGITINDNVMFDNFFYGGGFKFVTAESDGTIRMSDDISSERLVNWFRDCQSLLNDNGDVALEGIAKFFTEGRSIFHCGTVADVQNYLKDVDFDFGILPFPKYSADQKDYATIVGYWVTMYSVPIDAADMAMSGAVLEYLGYEGATNLTPVVYRDAFQYRYLGTEDNARMFDLLHDTLVYDTGRIFADQVACFSSFRQAATPTVDWTSYSTSQKKVWAKNVSNIYTQLG